MARRQSIGIRQELTRLIPTRQLNRLARLSGLVRRRRKIDPMELFWTVVLGFGAGHARTLAGMRRAYQKSTGATLVPSAFYDRFTRSLAVFMRLVVQELLEKLQETEAKFSGLLRSFRDVVGTDSTLVKLHDLLERRFPACRTNHTKVAAKLHVVMSVRGQGPRTVKLTSGPATRRADAAGGALGARPAPDVRPGVLPVSAVRLHRPERRLLHLAAEGERQSGNHRHPETVAGPQRVAGGGATAGRHQAPATRDPGRRGGGRVPAPGVWGASIGSPPLPAPGRGEERGHRTLMKSHYRLEDLPSRKPHIVEALLYATLVTLVVSRRLLRAVRQALRGRPHAVPEGRWAAIFATVSSAVLDLVLAPARLARDLARWTEAMLLREAVDPNLSRRSLLACVENGATW